jgi:hypothetical protein
VRHFTHGLLHFLVRLACVRHAASVDSEPGSNSRLKPEVSQFQDGGPEGETSLTELENSVKHYIVRMIKPKLHRFLTTGMFNLIVKDPRR